MINQILAAKRPAGSKCRSVSTNSCFVSAAHTANFSRGSTGCLQVYCTLRQYCAKYHTELSMELLSKEILEYYTVISQHWIAATSNSWNCWISGPCAFPSGGHAGPLCCSDPLTKLSSYATPRRDDYLGASSFIPPATTKADLIFLRYCLA